MNNKLCLIPGDRVRLTKDMFDTGVMTSIPGRTILVSTKGSIGIVVSFDDYRAEREQRLMREGIELETYEHSFLIKKESIEACRKYPIRFKLVQPTEIPVDLVGSEVGKIE